jgi:hypothetical protein
LGFEIIRTAAALALHCAFLCAGMIVLAGVGWFLAALGVEVLILPVFGLGLLVLFPVAFALAVRLAVRWFR